MLLDFSQLDVSWIRENASTNVKEMPISAAITVGLGAATVIGGYALLSSRYQKWKELGIEGPEPNLFFGNMLPRFTLSQGTVPDLEIQLLEKYGKIYGFYEMSIPILVVAEPDILKSIFVRDFTAFMNRRSGAASKSKIAKHFLTDLKGDDWRRARNSITPTFTSGKMKVMFSLMDECAVTLTDILDRKAQTGEEVDIKEVYGCFTLDVVAKCAFATETNAQTLGRKSTFVNHAINIVSPSKLKIIAAITLPRAIFSLIKSNEHMNFMERTVKSILSERRKIEYEGYQYKDFLQILTESIKEENKLSNGDAERKKTLSEDEVVANSIVFLLAGYETTATLLTYLSYALAMNPDVQEKLRAECRAAFEAAGNKIDYDSVWTLKYLDATVNETLRMFPPVVRIDRVVAEHYKMDLPDGKTVRLVPGDIVRIPIYAIHHCEDFYPNHKQFQPERFMPDNRDRLVPYTYVPFGDGPRNCIGMRFALLEAKIALMRLLLRYRIVKSPKTPEKPDFSRAQTLLAVKNMYVKVEML